MTYNRKEFLEAVETVDKMNEFLYEKYGDEYDKNDVPVISLTRASYMLFINISIGEIDLKIYSSVNDDRIYDELKNEYETIEDLIFRKFQETKDIINSVEL